MGDSMLTDDTFCRVADALHNDDHIEVLGKKLGFDIPQISRYIETNRSGDGVTTRGTKKMLRDWGLKTPKSIQLDALRAALIAAELVQIADSCVQEQVLTDDAKGIPLALQASDVLGVTTGNEEVKQTSIRLDYFCENHKSKEAEVFCETHQACYCHACAYDSHHKGQCQTQLVYKIVAERIGLLLDLVSLGNKKIEEVEKYDSITKQQAKNIDRHLLAIGDELNAAVDEETKKVEEDKEQTANRISMETDAEIRKIQERKREMLRRNEQEAQLKRERIREAEKRLNVEYNSVKAAFEKKKDDMMNQYQELSSNVRENLSLIEQLVEDKAVLKDYDRVAQSLNKCLQCEVSIKLAGHIASQARRIGFVRRGSQSIGKICEPIWERVASFSTGNGSQSFMVGSITEDEVVVLAQANKSLYVTNLKKEVEKRDVGKIPHIFRCATLSDGRIVCGTRDGRVVVYDQNWELLWAINMSQKFFGLKSAIIVSVDSDDKILAAVHGKSTIHIINPDNGEITRSISVADTSVSLYDIQGVSSGQIAGVCSISRGTERHVCVLNSSGAVISTIYFRRERLRSIAHDRSDDSIYILYDDYKLNYAVDLKFPNELEAVRKKIVEFQGTSKFAEIRVPEPGKIVIHNEGVIHIFDKTVQVC